MNCVCLTGRLCTDVELKYTATSVPVANFRIAVDRQFKNAAGERESDFFTVTAWRKTAEFAANYLTKGRLVAVEGVLQARQWTAQDGSKRSTVEVIANNVQGLDKPKDGEGGGQQAAPQPQGQEAAGNAVGGDADDFTDPFAD